jgi:uncharacterized membrane protein
MSTGRQPKRTRQPNGSRQFRDATVGKLLTIHDISIEKLKSSLVIFLSVPKIRNDKIEAAATAWKAKNVPIPCYSVQLKLRPPSKGSCG